ncbi:hypothetical protein B0H17DRAFT_891001, partial [Mycena rosella]
VNLWSVSDPADGTRPTLSLPVLARLAIYGSATKKLSLQGIYRAIITRFSYYREHQEETRWKNSIRHALSLHKVFVKVKRPIHEAGKGDYWVLDVSRGNGYKRARKR